ncbi:P-loop containing nucleoside triphosphate hydrolase [Cinara cedri]|uniref:P-loop containing nucleoside triphosphate hydrolase n=1 Tax=Cinara cedri TaxID=506608 RepID=A0A5E4MV27_9HEMI|nr:P-loop containing nucleoside triphosphate hydrolase [Cinara cedri]
MSRPDSGTCLITETRDGRSRAEQYAAEKRRHKADNAGHWYPRIVSSYGLTENSPWTRRLNADHEIGATGIRCPVRAADEDFYGYEDADAAALARKPVSFVIFGKPGTPDEQLADILAAYWGCVHVSPALGLVSGRADARTKWKLHRGDAVNAADSLAMLVALLGLDSPEIRERGYVLTGLPRHGTVVSSNAQIHAVFAKNPPDVLIYLSLSNRELYKYRDGLILESMDHKHLTQKLHIQQNDFEQLNHRHVKWYKSLRNTIMNEFDLNDYEKHSLAAVDETFKRFGADRTITVDCRRPVVELFQMIKAKLKTMPLKPTLLPEIINRGYGSSTLYQTKSYRIAEDGEMEEMEDESLYVDDEHEGETNGEYESTDNGNGTSAKYQREDRIRLISEFGQLCPVNFYYGLFKMGTDRYSVKFMGKLYLFAGPDEMKLFSKFPRQFVFVPRLGMPIRAIFYGPEAMSGPAAKAVSNFFGCNLIDAKHIRQRHEEKDKQSFASTIFNSVLNTVREITTLQEETNKETNAISIMRNAIGDWIRLNSVNLSHEDITAELDIRSSAGGGGEDEVDENYMYLQTYSDQNTKDLAKNEQLKKLRNRLESYFIDFVDNLDECIRAYNDPMVLIKYLRLRFLRENKIAQTDFIDVIVDEVQARNKQYKNWIIANAPLDFQLVKKLIDSDLNPIQMVFFHDADPAHKILLNDETLTRNWYKTIRKTFENVKNGTRHGTLTERETYPEFISGMKNSIDNDAQYDVYDDLPEEELEDYESRLDIIIDNNTHLSHNYIMEIILPEIVKRLNQYTEDLFQQWTVLKQQSLKIMDQYVDFNVIECKPDPSTNILSVLIEDTLYYIKKFLSERVYSKFSDDNNVPTVSIHNGNTSVYCPVSFKNGKLLVGSKQYAAVYQNRYYYMSSSKHFKAFISNPVKYALFTSNPKSYPKPKISLLSSFGLDATDFNKKLLDTFDDFTLVDSYKIFKQNVLPKNTPMLGKMHEEPTLKKIMDEHFVTVNHNQKYINNLRKYVNRESAYLSDENWMKLNSVFCQADGSVFYQNYPRNLVELKYLKHNGINPDVIVEVVAADEEKKQNDAKHAAIKNWLTYQYALIENVIKHDDATRRITASRRSALFKSKLAELVNRKIHDRIKSRLHVIIDMIVVETEYGPDNAMIEQSCQNQQPLLSGVDSTVSTLSKLRSRYSEMTLKHKKIVIDYGLAVEDFVGMDDFETLEKIDKAVDDEIPEPELLITKCFSDKLKFPSDAMIAAQLNTEKTVLDGMRKFARSSGIPWITTVLSADDQDSRSATLCNDIARALPSVDHCDSLFETTFKVNLDEAERMLRFGEVYLSKYGHWCPVHMWNENPETAVQRFYADSVEGRAFAVVHRKYVYFLSGPEHRDEFAQRPLHYAYRSFAAPANIALRLAVVGPPVSGKSRTVRVLCDRYGLELVRIEQAVESYLNANGWTDDAQSAVQRLNRGCALMDVTLVEAVKMAVQTTRAAVCGYVLDGFPITENQFKLLDDSGIILHRVFVIQNDTLFVGEGRDDGHMPYALLNDALFVGEGRDDVHMPYALLLHRLHAWNVAFVGLEWISDRYGNATAIVAGPEDDNDDDGWMTVVDEAVRAFLGSAREYDKAMREGRPVRLAGLAVTVHERQAMMSTFLNQCPVCRVDENCLNNGPDNDPTRNLVQHLSFVYRVCPVHWDAFAANPDRYANLAPREPEKEPVHVTDEELYVNPYVHRDNVSVYCAVCALRRLWDPVYSRGDSEHLVKYGKRVYALCSAECMGEFMRQPFAYAEYVMCVRGPAGDEPLYDVDRCGHLDVDNLPVLGYLEQTIAGHVSDALTLLSAMKPVYPGLTAEATAMVCLGLYVGMHGTDDTVNAHYRDTFARFVDTCHRFKTEVFKLKLVM